MSETPLPPAGWYPSGEDALQYWDGTTWTAHTTPTPLGDQRTTPKANQNRSLRIRWVNLLSLRWWWFTLGGTAFLVVLLAMLSPTIAVILSPLILAGVGFLWLTVPMTCAHCGKMLKSSKMGNVTICHHCQQPVN